MDAGNEGGPEITGITCDSRRVEPGFIFAAIPGLSVDGRAYIADALGRGAAAILAPPGTRLPTDDQQVPLIETDNPRRRYALLAARFFDRQPETVAAVTGTNGKTSIADFLRQIWKAAGLDAASAGTIGIRSDHLNRDVGLTTPDPADLHRDLAELARSGVDHLALEASSHGLDQYRLDGVKVAAAAFTNLSRDHLDYHGDEASYLAAKRRLFSDLLVDGGTAVICADDAHGRAMIEAARARGLTVVSYGETGEDIRLAAAEARDGGQRLTISLFGETHEIDLPLVGRFQALNALCALGLAIATGVDPSRALAALSSLVGAPGRMEFVGRTETGAAVYVDYAHTPDALANVLSALRPHCRGRLHVVFGCGGDRDRGKRPQMGAIAADLADRVIVTDDNPRGEDPAAIRREILTTCPDAEEIGDRHAAIRAAVDSLAEGDILVVAGKGHEQGQTVAGRVLPFDDRDEVRKVLQGEAS